MTMMAVSWARVAEWFVILFPKLALWESCQIN
jgi:hypothetical protein